MSKGDGMRVDTEASTKHRHWFVVGLAMLVAGVGAIVVARSIPDASVDITNPVVEIDATSTVTCAAVRAAEVRCWGRDPVAIDGTRGVTRLAAAGVVSCGVSPEGHVLCWRSLVQSEGDDEVRGRWAGDTHARRVKSLEPAESLAVSDEGLVCGVAAGRIRCVDGIDGASVQRIRSFPEEVRDVRQVVFGSYALGCIVDGSSRLRCWGDDDYEWSAPPELSDVVSVAITKNGTTCAVQAAGEVVCQGDGARGELGSQAHLMSSSWRRIPGIDDAVQVAAGVNHVCVRRRSGEVACWGDRGWGSLGDNEFLPRSEPMPTPQRVVGLSDVIDITATCAVVRSGTVKCWGDNFVGQLGTGDLTPSAKPSTVRNLS